MTLYTLYIDESGEAGIRNVRSGSSLGASPFMTLGAVLTESRRKSEIERCLQRVQKLIGKRNGLHCAQLSHSQKVFYTRSIASQPVICFGLISRKGTLGNYGNRIGHNPRKFYNKCAQYLLERVGKFLQDFAIRADDVDVVFEEGLFDYATLRAFIGICQKNPKHPDTAYLRNINIAKLKSAKKSEESLLQLADLVAHSLYQTVHKSDKNHNIPEPRYLKELQHRFYADGKTGEVLSHGIKLVHELEDIKFDADVELFIRDLRGLKGASLSGVFSADHIENTQSAPGFNLAGVSVTSRIDDKGEIDLMNTVLDSLKPKLTKLIQEVWCDSKADSTFFVHLKPCLRSDANAIGQALLKAFIKFNGGHNGIYLEGAKGEIIEIGADWNEGDVG